MLSLLLTGLCLTMTLSSLLVVTTTSPVLSVLYLVALFLQAAVYMSLQGLPFAALVYLVVYIGAVAVLFLFVIMMISPLVVYSTSVRSLPLALMIISLSLLLLMIGETDSPTPNEMSVDNVTTVHNQAQTVAVELFTHQALLLMIIGLVLLLAMIGPVAMSVDHITPTLRRLQRLVH